MYYQFWESYEEREEARGVGGGWLELGNYSGYFWQKMYFVFPIESGLTPTTRTKFALRVSGYWILSKQAFTESQAFVLHACMP